MSDFTTDFTTDFTIEFTTDFTTDLTTDLTTDPSLWSAYDFRVKMCPKFAEEKFSHNLALVDQVA